MGNPAPPADLRAQARQILEAGGDREAMRTELAGVRDRELLRLLHEAAVMDASPFWREYMLRRFIRDRGSDDGRQDT